MATATLPDSLNTAFPIAPSTALLSQRERIAAALGQSRGRLPHVDGDSLRRYYEHLAANLAMPFTAWYPQPTNARQRSEYRVAVVELLDPDECIGDALDGLFCKTRKGEYEVNLPLIELEVSPESPNYQLIEDFWFWFWNWR